MNFYRLTLLFAFFTFFLSADLLAQDPPKGENQPERKLTKREKEWLAEQEYWKTVDKVREMSREQKNTMTSCPLHNPNKEMPMSDNYRPSASDYTTCDEYPFAYQLNYRRYCKICTKIMAKESGEGMPVIPKATFERCELHNIPLKGNPDYDGLSWEKRPSENMPHARQYKFRNYCKLCTKAYKIQEDSEEKK